MKPESAGRRPLRIMLADPPVQEEHYIYYQPTMGILYLLGSLRKAFSPADVDVRYLQAFGSLRDHLRAIEDYQPDIYGLSFKTPMARLGHRTLRAVKERFPSLTVIAGGSHVSVMADEVMNLTPVDACFVGECEETIVQIVEAFGDNRVRCDAIPGAIYRSGSSLIRNAPSPFRQNLDSFPWPAWDTIDFDRFPGLPYREEASIPRRVDQPRLPVRLHVLLGTRLEDLWPPDVSVAVPRKHRRGDRVPLRARGARAPALVRGVQYPNPLGGRAAGADRGARLRRSVHQLQHPRRRHDGGHGHAMAAANVWLVTMGFESASNRVLKGVRKQVTVEQIEATCALLSRGGIKVAGYFQFYSAWEESDRLFWETPQDCRRTIQWAVGLGNAACSTTCSRTSPHRDPGRRSGTSP